MESSQFILLLIIILIGANETIKLQTKYKPLPEQTTTMVKAKLGEPLRINKRIKANPKPTIMWKIGDENLYENTFNKRYEVPSINNVTKDSWNVTLIIKNFETLDLGKNIYLIAKNSVGKQIYPLDIVMNYVDIPESKSLLGIVLLAILGANITTLWIALTKLYFRNAHDPDETIEHTTNNLN